MINLKVCYSKKPDEVHYMPLPNGGADVWLRKDIAETDEGWEADEAYIRFGENPPDEEEIHADFEGWYRVASVWEPESVVPIVEKTAEERISILENENKILMEVIDHILMEV